MAGLITVSQINPQQFLLFSHLTLGITFLVVTVLIIIYIARRIRLKSLPEDIPPGDPDDILIQLGIGGVEDLKTFKNVPRNMIEDYLEFLRAHPKKTFIEIEGTKWEYRISGSGAKILLVMPGGTRRPFLGYELTKILEQDFTIIEPLYPPLISISDLVSGIYQILVHEKVEKVCLLGSSFGGIMCQVFMYHHSEMVDRMILSNTGTLKMDGRSKEEFEKRCRKALRMLDIFPTRICKYMMKRGLGKIINAAEPDRKMYVALLNYYTSAKANTKLSMACHFLNLLDFSMRYTFSLEYTRLVAQKTLVITSVGDAGVAPDAKELLKSTYLGARFYEFKEGGHTPALVNPDEYVRLIKQFCT